MNPSAVRDFVPERLHVEFDDARRLVEHIAVLGPAAFAGVWASHLLAMIEESEVAPWIGCALFLGSDPLGQLPHNPRLWDEERDWNRHSALLADLQARFGEAICEPLGALPRNLTPRLVTDYLHSTVRDRRVLAAEALVGSGDLEAAAETLLNLWREGGDPLVADLLDVLDPHLGPAMSPAEAMAYWDADSRSRTAVGTSRALRSRLLGYNADPVAVPGGGADVSTVFKAMGHGDPDPRIASAVRAVWFGWHAREPGASRAVPGQAAGSALLARAGDVRWLSRVAALADLEGARPNGMWAIALGPDDRAVLRSLGARIGGELSPPSPSLRALRLQFWRGDDAAGRVYADALRERGDALAPALDGGTLADLPPRTVHALTDRPVGLCHAGYRGGHAVGGELVGVGDRDPAWGTVEMIELRGPQAPLPLGLSRLRSVRLVSTAWNHLSIEAIGDCVTRVQALHPGAKTFIGPNFGLALVPSLSSVVLTQLPGPTVLSARRFGARAPGMRSRVRCRHLAVLGPPGELLTWLAELPPTVETFTLCEYGVPTLEPRGVQFVVDRRHGQAIETWHPPSRGRRAPGELRAALSAMGITLLVTG